MLLYPPIVPETSSAPHRSGQATSPSGGDAGRTEHSMAGWNLTSAGSRVPRDRQRRPDRRQEDSMSTRTEAVLGVDVGTSSTKGVLVALDGTVLDVAVREHSVQRPAPGHVEMDARIWWTEFISIARELTTGVDAEVTAIGVSRSEERRVGKESGARDGVTR